jgi:hypothetical protein
MHIYESVWSVKITVNFPPMFVFLQLVLMLKLLSYLVSCECSLALSSTYGLIWRR